VESNLAPEIPILQQPDIFNFMDYRKFLKAYYQYQKNLNSNFSYTIFARKVGLSRSFLHHVINYQGILQEDKALKLAHACKFNQWESDFFLALVMWNQSKDEKMQKLYWERMMGLSPKEDFYSLQGNEEKVITHWFSLALLELVTIKGFVNDVDWMAQKFGNKVSPQEIQETLDLLLIVGLLQFKNKRLVKTKKTVVAKRMGKIPPSILREYHKKNIPLGIEAIDSVDPSLREISTMSIAIEKKKIALLKNKIKNFRAEILEYVDACSKPEEVYQLNIQFFPLDNSKTPGKP